MKHPSMKSIQRLIAAYKAKGFASSEICDKFRVMFDRRGLGRFAMAARLSWYGLRD